MDKKRVFIIHGWGGKPEQHWFPWLKRELESNGFEVSVPAMPNAEEPEIEAWIGHLEKLVGEPNEQTYFIGFSIGCQAVLRYLERINDKVGGAVFVAGFFELPFFAKEIVKPWLETPIDFEKARNTTNKFIAILSDDDYYVPFEKHQKSFQENLGAEIIVEHNKGHFLEKDGVTELPSALESVLEISK